jgi:amino acid adenylation domain-containing protein
LGRIDNQVKIRGFRIELGEIEAILVQHPHVQESAVIVDQEPSGNKRLVAYFVAELTPSASELRDFLKQKLPDYMLPAYFIKLDSLPLTPNGKINRRALQSLEVKEESEKTFLAPRTPEEEILAGLWAEILNIKQVGIHDNFFELGGHSLFATQLMSRIRDSFSVELPVSALFQSPSLSSLTEKIKATQSPRSTAPAIKAIERTGDIPLSFAQQRLWFLAQLEGGSSATYNMPAALHLSGRLHINALKQSLTVIVQRHETLRTTFPTQLGMPSQHIQPLSVIKEQLSVVRLSALPTEKQAAEVQRLVSEEAQRPFNLTKGPLFRTTLLQLGAEEHVLLMTMHHIISDGWSIGVFIREIGQLYEAFEKGLSSPLSPLPIQYVDFAHWQRQWLTGEVLEKQVKYWEQQLSGIPALLELPTDRPRPPVQTFKGHTQHFEITTTLSTQLKAFSQKQGTTLFMTLFSAYVILLHRYSGQEDIIVGSPIANRNRSEIESLIGFFVNTLVLRTQLADNPHFLDLLNQVREMSLEAYVHQDMPFETLVEIVQPERNLSHNPLFQVMFVLQNAPKEKVELPGLNIRFLERESVTTKSDLTLFMEETPEGLKGGLEYNTALFNADTIERMAGHFQTLLADIIAHPERRISELQILPPAEQYQLLIDWNNTTATYPENQCFHQLFEAQVEKTPEAIAVVFEKQELSYQALNTQANQLAHHLQTLGVGPEILVGICVERSLEMIIGLLATLKAGGAYVPLDPHYPQERLAFMLADSQVLVLLTQKELLSKLPAHQAQVICLNNEQSRFSNLNTSNLNSDVQPNNLAYVIYTSGSTGKPKGVLVEHRGLTNLAQAQIKSFDVRPGSRVLQLASFSFDASVSEIVMALASGATLCLGTTESLLPGPALVEQLCEQRITHVTFPPATLAVLPTDNKLLNLAHIIVAGDACSPEIAACWSEGRRFFNAYGPTEDTVCATIFEYTAEYSNLSIGRPIGNQHIYILDQQQHPVPIGVPGELYIGGVGLARGYLNRPDLTQDKFIPNPFVEFGKHSDQTRGNPSLFKSERLYKTGDLARYLPDGNIEFLGRLDHQVKIRGFRIELGEIENLLSQHPNVQETLVIAREDKPGKQSLVAYFVSDLIPQKLPYHKECLVERNGERFTFISEDISRQGICLQQDKGPILQQGDEIRLQLELSNESLWLPGKVIWSRTSWAGIDFTPLTNHEQARLARHFESLLAEKGLLHVVQNLLVGNLRHYLQEKLPHYMVPTHFVLLTAFPLTPNGKIDRNSLPAPEYERSLVKKDFLPQTELENQIAAVWQDVLEINKVGIYDHFFEIGGHSLLIGQVQAKLQDRLGQQISMVDLFENPTIHALAQHLSEKKAIPLPTQTAAENRAQPTSDSNEIAIIGMAGRFPGANDVEAFWENLQNGVESITFFSDEEVRQAGIDNATLNQPHYIKAGGVLSEVDQFDAPFFDFSPKEAEQMDPQHRLFLECAWQAIEHAGIEPGTEEFAIGVYAGVGMNTYLLNNLYPHHKASSTLNHYQLMIGNSNDFLPTRVSYKLNLKGPSVNIQTACSTSLVAIHSACQSLLDGECDVALAGGVSIRVPQKTGYLYQEGMIMSPDGHCRAFDAHAQGTVMGNGVGVVVLKKLENALADGDCIHAIIKGSAINNDGSVKVGYTAPSVEGQASVIAEAQANADVKADTISYIETHGTATKLGDPIEMAALNKVFQTQTQKKGFCAIGAVKSNIGHTDAAAGVAGLIKTVQALKHQCLPPTLHFEQPNPQIDLANSPFYIKNTASEWKTSNGKARRAGVSSFGIGGTNAHLVLEEAPTRPASSESRPSQLLVLSAKTASALETATSDLAIYLEQHPENKLADVAYTLSKGRKAFSHRRLLIAQDTDEASCALHRLDPTTVLSHSQAVTDRPIVFMFSGQGSQYVNMGFELYQTEPLFKEEIDQCAAYLKPQLELDLREILYPSAEQSSEASRQLKQTAIAQPALFVIEYALAKLWMSWGVQPDAMIGHSLGEYVAACLSGVFSLEEALSLVAARGQLMQQLPQGAMLSVSLSEAAVQSLLEPGLDLAAINSPGQCVVSGANTAIDALENQLTQEGIACQRLHTSHAFHSKMMAPITASFTQLVKQVRLCPPQIPYLSNFTGNWISAEETLDHHYWAKHLRHTVHFTEGMQQLLKNPRQILLEIGPGRTLSTLAKRHPDKSTEQVVLSSLRHPQEQQSDQAFLLKSLGQVWLAGGNVNWSGFYANESRHRVPLPTYPFERQSYWIAPPTQEAEPIVEPVSINDKTTLAKKSDMADWFYRPTWKESVPPTQLFGEIDFGSCLLFLDCCDFGSQLVKTLEKAGQKVSTVKIGREFREITDHDYMINPQHKEDYEALIKALRTHQRLPKTIIHLWSITPNNQEAFTLEGIDESQTFGYYSLLFLSQALGKQNVTDEIQIAVISNNMQTVTDEEVLYPEKATLLGPIKVIGQEYPNLRCRSIDLKSSVFQTGKGHVHFQREKLITQLLAELTIKSDDQVIAYRGSHRWVQTFEQIPLEKPINNSPRLRENGVYLITGGLGGMGLTFAEHLAKTVRAKLVLLGRSAFPDKTEWDNWLITHPEQETISIKIRKIQALEKQGAEILIAQADVANLQQMQAVITTTEQRFGAINGVIHAAGLADGALILRQTQKMSERIFAPKLKGTWVLDSLLQNVELDFFLLCSSLASVLGIGGQIGYCAANAFLDVFAQFKMANGNYFTAAINWDAWQEVGMAVNTVMPVEIPEKSRTDSLQQGILPKEGIGVFNSIMGSTLPQILVSTNDLMIRLEQQKASGLQRLLELSDQSKLPKNKYSRPQLSDTYKPPRTELEQSLTALWQNVLGIKQIGIHDDFFELGGDSLIAVQLIAKLREKLPMSLSAHSLLNAPTIASLAELIEQTTPMPERTKSTTQDMLPSALVEIQTGNGLKTPLFLIHPVGGHVYFYRDLAHHLGSEQPVYGIQAEGIDGEGEPLTRVEEMASHYIEVIRVRQPEGPYFIGGSSFGGTVAFEMAQQLKALGQKVALLTMIDTPGPGEKPTKKLETDEEILAYTLNVGANISVSLEALQKLEAEDQLHTFLQKQTKANQQMWPDFDMTQIRHFLDLFKINAQAMLNYKPQATYQEQIIFFRAKEKDAYNAKTPERAWFDFAQKGLKVIEVPGNHFTMHSPPHVQVMAKQLRSYLN